MRLNKYSSRSLVCFAFAGLLSAGSALALTLEEVPKAVRKTIEKDANGGKILSITESTEGDKKLFTATIAENGGDVVIVVGEHGRLIRHGHLGKVIREEKKEAHEAKKEEKETKKEEKGKEKPAKTASATVTTEAGGKAK